MEGKRESRKRKWMRYELQHRIELIKDGVMPQKAELEEPMWQQMQTIGSTEETKTATITTICLIDTVDLFTCKLC